jgi:hypothetical protein
VLVQYVILYQRLEGNQLSPNVSDQLEWHWSVSGCYSSNSTYATLLLGQSSFLGAKELWKTKAPNKYRFFVWLVLLNRCWTAEHLQCHGIRSSSSCILCCQGVEMVDHLMVQCVFSREDGFKVLWRCGWHGLALDQDNHFAKWWTTMRKWVLKHHCKAFDSLVLAVAWGIWI